MSNSDVSVTKKNEVELISNDMFEDLPALDPFEVKKQYLAADLLAIVAFKGISKASLAENLGWHKSAVTRLFSGKSNPTVKTIWSLSTFLGYDFDITFRKHDQPSHPQPWHTCEVVSRNTPSQLTAQFLHFVEAQTPEQAKSDLNNGIQKGEVYAIFKTPEKNLSNNPKSEQILMQHKKSNIINTVFNNNPSRTTIVTK